MGLATVAEQINFQLTHPGTNMKLTQLTPKCYAVTELPEGAEAWMNESYHVNTVWYKAEGMRYPKCFDLPEGNWTVLGFAQDLTEDQWKQVVPQYKAAITGYLDYTTGRPDTLVETATESGHSAVKKAGLFVENPYDKDPNILNMYPEWMEAQLLTNPLIIVKS